MQNTTKMIEALQELLNTDEVQEQLKPMFELAKAEGRIKTQEDMEKFKAGFMFHLISTNKELFSIFAHDMYIRMQNQQLTGGNHCDRR